MISESGEVNPQASINKERSLYGLIEIVKVRGENYTFVIFSFIHVVIVTELILQQSSLPYMIWNGID